MDAKDLALICKEIEDLRALAEDVSRIIKEGQGVLVEIRREINWQRRAVEADAVRRRQPWRRTL